MKNKNKKTLKRVGKYMHTHALSCSDDDYRMELADEESNPRISVPKKTKKKLKAVWFFQRDVWMIVREGESCSLSKSFMSTSIARYR